MKLHKNHWLLNSPIAHRGLHNELAPENTLLAFQNAIDNGHPIELDVQALKDGTLLVFHDESTKRLCGINTDIRSMTYKHAKQLLVYDKFPIPTLHEALEFIDGKVPILIEVKNEKFSNDILHLETLEVLKSYTGEYAVQSFNPLTVRYFLKHLPNIPVGQISGSLNDTKLNSLKKFYLKNVLDSYIYRPSFLSYEWSEIYTLSNIFLNKLFKVPILAWTITNDEQKKEVEVFASNYIFEKVYEL